MPTDKGPLLRAAPLRSWNDEQWSFDIVLSAGSPVTRYDTRGAFEEVLDVAGATWPASIPLMDAHRRESIEDQLGVVENIRREGAEIIGTARLSKNSARAQRVAADLRDGITYSGSIGYAVADDAWAETRPDGKRTKTATRFAIHELSLVSIPADPASKIRSTTLPTQLSRAQINAEVRTIAAKAGLDDTWINTQIDADEVNLDSVRTAAFDAMTARSQATGTLRATVQVGADHADPVAIRTAMADALAHRLAPGSVKIEGRAREFASHRVVDMVGDLAHARGDNVNLRDRDALIERAMGAHSTSDFLLLLSDAANKALLAQYQVAAPTYRRWSARKSFNDFREHNFLRIGDFPSFKEMEAEGGDVQYGTLSENREKVSVKEFNTGIIVGRRLLANDDLTALADFSSMIAVRAAADENRMVYSLLTGSPTLSDGVVLFHADHGNLAGSGAAISDTTVGTAIASLRKQKSLDGLALNIVPRYLVVGPDSEMAARKLLAAITPTKSADANPWSGSMELIVDANIVGNSWFIMADPAAVPSIVYGYYGAEGPTVRTEIDFGTRAIKVAAGLDWGCGVIDFRGGFKNAGA